MNKGLLPSKQYTEEEETLHANETLNSEQVKNDQKNSLSDVKNQNKYNYESDTGAVELSSQRRAIEARAKKFRNQHN